jgi:sugar-specific transcriptional regulator TrmB
MQAQQALEEWGLNDKEIKVYLATLELGQSKVNEISKKANILRETTYFVLNSLIERGLVSYVIKSGVKYFEAAAPSKLLSTLKEKEEKIKQAMPELEELQKFRAEKPTVELYEGKEGLKTILDDIIKTKKPMWAYANYKIFELLQYSFPRFVKRRVENKIKVRIIQEKVKPLIRSAEVNKNEYREIRFSPTTFKSNVFIYGDKVAMINVTKEQPMGVIIKNKSIADTQRQVFEMLWELSKL